MHPQTPVVLDHPTETRAQSQALLSQSNTSKNALFTKGEWLYPKRFQVNPVQLFALQAEHESELLMLGQLVNSKFSAGQLLTQRKLRQVIAVDRQVPKWLIHPETEDLEQTHTITELQQRIALAIAATLVRWSAATGSRLVTFTNSSLYGKFEQQKVGQTKSGKPIYEKVMVSEGPIFKEFGCSLATYKKALRLLALAKMPTLHLRHTDEHGNLTNVDRCLAVLLPTLPRNARLDLSCKLPPDSLARSLEPGHQLTFTMIAADPGYEESISPPYVTTTHQVRSTQTSISKPSTQAESPFAESRTASRTRAQELLGIKPAGLAGKRRAVPLPRSAAELQAPASYAMLRALWIAQFGPELLAEVYFDQRKLIDLRFDALTSLVGRRAANSALLNWIRSLGRRSATAGRTPHPRWIFGFISREIAKAHRLATSEPSKAPTSAARRAFGQALFPASKLITANEVRIELVAIAVNPDSGARTAVTTGNHTAWQMIAHEPGGAALLRVAARSCGCESVMFQSAGGRSLDTQRISYLETANKPSPTLTANEDPAQLVATIDKLSPIHDSAARACRAIAIAIPDPSNEFQSFTVTHLGGRRFEVALPSLRYQGHFGLRYQRIYTRVIAQEFAEELRGLSPVLVFAESQAQ